MNKVGNVVYLEGRPYVFLGDGKFVEVSHFNEDGTPVLRTKVTKREEVVDGVKRVSTHVSVEPFNMEMKEQQ